MGFKKPNIETAYSAIRKSLGEIRSPYNDGYIQRDCKHELYLLKCWLEDEYSRLPEFTGEEEWAQERLVEILKK
jgi:hypothetical protein